MPTPLAVSPHAPPRTHPCPHPHPQREENEKRRATGLPALPEEDPTLPFFRPFADTRAKEPLDMLLMSAQISNYCSQVAKFSGASFGKLFLAGSLHK